MRPNRKAAQTQKMITPALKHLLLALSETRRRVVIKKIFSKTRPFGGKNILKALVEFARQPGE